MLVFAFSSRDIYYDNIYNDFLKLLILHTALINIEQSRLFDKLKVPPKVFYKEPSIYYVTTCRGSGGPKNHKFSSILELLFSLYRREAEAGEGSENPIMSFLNI